MVKKKRKKNTTAHAATHHKQHTTARHDKPLPSLFENPKQGTIAAIVSLFIILVITFRNAIFTASYSLDMMHQGYVFIQFFLNQLYKNGHVPFWMPFMNGGTPCLEGTMFSPGIAAFIQGVLSPDISRESLRYVMFAFSAGLYTYFFLRAREHHRLTAIISATAVMTATVFVSYIQPGHDGKIIAISAIMAVMMGTEFWFKTKKWYWIVVTGTAIGWVMFGHPQILYYFLLFYTPYFFIRIFGEMKTDNAALKRGIITFACIGAMAMLIAGSQLYSTLFNATQTSRGGLGQGGQDFAFATSWSFYPPELSTFFAPGLFGLASVPGHEYWGPQPFVITSFYFGLTVLLLSVFGFVYRARRDYGWFFITAIALFIIASFGRHLEPVYRIIYQFPGINKFRQPSTMLLLLPVFFVPFVARGIDTIITLPTMEKKDKQKAWIILGSFILIALTISIWVNNTGFTNTIIHAGSIKADGAGTIAAVKYEPEQINAYHELAVNSLSHMWFFLISICIVIAMALMTHKPSPAIRWLILILVFLDLLTINNNFVIPVSKMNSATLTKYDLNGYTENTFESQAVKFLKEDTEPYRLNVLRAHDPERNKWALHEIETINGYNALSMGRFERLRSVTQNFFFGAGQGKNFSLMPFMNLFNVKYIGTYDMNQQAAFLFTPIRTFQNDEPGIKNIMLNPSCLPRAFLIGNYEVIPEGEGDLENLETHAQEMINFIEATISNTGAWEGIENVVLSAEPSLPIEKTDTPYVARRIASTGDLITQYGLMRDQYPEGFIKDVVVYEQTNVNYTRIDPDHIRMTVSAPANAILFVSEIYYPRWKATIDGQPAPIIPANHAFRAVAVPAGQHIVEMKYGDTAPYTILLLLMYCISIAVFALMIFVLIKGDFSFSMLLKKKETHDKIEESKTMTDTAAAIQTAGSDDTENTTEHDSENQNDNNEKTQTTNTAATAEETASAAESDTTDTDRVAPQSGEEKPAQE